MTRAQRTTLGALLLLACGIWLAVLYVLSGSYQAWSQKPLGPTLAYPTGLGLPATWTASPAPPTVVMQETLVPTKPSET